MNTKIEWTEKVWNPTSGCSPVSDGCAHCYAAAFARRQMGPWRGRAFSEVRCHEDRLGAPLHWRKPQRVFVNSMSDLFHPDVPDEFILRVMDVIRAGHAFNHTFQVLTKRPERMRAFMAKLQFDHNGPGRMFLEDRGRNRQGWPISFALIMKRLWLGVSVEDQPTADRRIPELVRTPAALRFVSCEPLLAPVDLRCVAPVDDYHCDALDTPDPLYRVHWVIVGGESGPKARPCDPDWIRSVIQQCRAAGVPCFTKQLGSRPDGWWTNELGPRLNRHCIKHPKGGDPSEWPEDLRVRQSPEAVSYA